MSHAYVILALSACILIHELGHLIAAKRLGIPVERFSIGFGPRLWSIRRQETEYRISLLPLGGYVLPKMESEEDFFAIAPGKRILFSLGGPVINILAALPLFAILNIRDAGFGFRALTIEPVLQTVSTLVRMIESIPHLFASPENLRGVVGIVSEGAQFAGTDPLRVLSFLALISLNLALFNLLPLSPLDGGKVLLTVLERIHRPLVRLHLPVTIAGWLLVVGLMTYTTVLDIGRL